MIATILKVIKDKLRVFFKNRPGGYKIEDFDWAVTVPALWGERARDMMREAGYLVMFSLHILSSSMHIMFCYRLVCVMIVKATTAYLFHFSLHPVLGIPGVK